MCYLKLLHLFSLFIWLGGVITLTYRVGYFPKEEKKEWRSFYYKIDLPAMVIAVLSGIILLIGKEISMKQPWLHMKLTAVFFLVITDLTVGHFLFKKKNCSSMIFKWLHGAVLFFIIAALFSICVLKIK